MADSQGANAGGDESGTSKRQKKKQAKAARIAAYAAKQDPHAPPQTAQGAQQPGQGKVKSQGQGPNKGQGQAPNKGQEQGSTKEQGSAKVQENAPKSGAAPQEGADGAPVKSKAQLKAERRAIQEAQRAAKLEAASEGGKKPSGSGGKPGGGGSKPGGTGGKPGGTGPKPGAGKAGGPVADAGKKVETASTPGSATRDGPRVPDMMQMDDEQTRRRFSKKLERQQVPQRSGAQRKVGLFRHLHQYEKDITLTKNIQFASVSSIHPAILRLGLQYAEGIVCGSNARCIALMAAMKQVIADYVTPPHKELSRDLELKIKPYISFLVQCRPLSVSMGNAIKYLKYHITQTPQEMSDAESKSKLLSCIDDFIRAKIQLAGQIISEYASPKIKDDDVILVYACSSLISRVLCDAHRAGKRFSVIVVDSRPKLEGRRTLSRLVKEGIKCAYIFINATSYVMPEVTKVFLGAHALLANGYVMSRVGSSQVSMLAKAYNVPVLVCCETYKFCERVQTDSFVFNELGDPNDLLISSQHNEPLSSWQDSPSLNLLNLLYDVTPPELITMVITELAIMPCTSVPVVLRVKHVEADQ